MAGGGGRAHAADLEFTPTWIVAIVCSAIAVVSLLAERSLRTLGKRLKKNNQKALYEALLKIKEELMLLGLTALLLVVFQGSLVRLCTSPDVMRRMLPCKKEKHVLDARYGVNLTEGAHSARNFCADKGKVPLLTTRAIHDLHLFIFMLAVTHIILSAITLPLSMLRIRQWGLWEASIQKEAAQKQNGDGGDIHAWDLEFIHDRLRGGSKHSGVLYLLYSFCKQFYHPLTKSDYQTMRFGFIKTHCPGNPGFNFYKCVVRGLEADFKKVVGISWYLWIFVVIFLLLNVHGWYLYFWAAFAPLILLLVAGTKLEYVITKLAHDVAEKHTVTGESIAIKPSDDYFWFQRPRFLLYVLHYILFQNAFGFAFFFWTWFSYGFHSCIMGEVGFLAPRLIIGVVVQILFSYSSLPLYSIVAQMGSSFKKSVFDEHVQEALEGWVGKMKTEKLS